MNFSQRAKILHSPTPMVAEKKTGAFVLRESTNSYNHQRKVIGSKALEGSDLFFLAMPLAFSSCTIEVENAKSANVIITDCLNEALRQIGYTVVLHRNPTKRLSTKWQGTCILEFDLDEFEYTYYPYNPKNQKPDTQVIKLQLKLINPGKTTLWD